MRKFIAIAMFVIAALLGMSSIATATPTPSEADYIEAAKQMAPNSHGVFIIFETSRQASRAHDAHPVKAEVVIVETGEKLRINAFHGEGGKNIRAVDPTPGVLNAACFVAKIPLTKKKASAWIMPAYTWVYNLTPVRGFRVGWMGTGDDNTIQELQNEWDALAVEVQQARIRREAEAVQQAQLDMLEAIQNRIDALDHSFVAPIPTPAQPELTERPEITFTTEATVAFIAIFCMLIGFVVIRRRREGSDQEEQQAVELHEVSPAQDTCPAPAPVTCDYTFETFAVVAPEVEVVVEAEKLDVVEFAVYAVNSSVAESAADAVVVGGLANILEILRDIAVEEVVAEEEHAETSEEDVCGELAAPTLMTASLGIVVVTVLTSLVWATEHRRRGAPMPRPPPQLLGASRRFGRYIPHRRTLGQPDAPYPNLCTTSVVSLCSRAARHR